MEDLTNNTRGLPPPQSYEAALQAACQKMMETATTLQSDLDRLNSEPRGRSHTHSQSGDCCRMQPSSQQRRCSGSQCRACSSQWVENRVRSSSPNHLRMHYQDERAHSLDHTQSHPHRWVSFHMPEGEAHSLDHTQSLPHRWVSFCMPEGEDMTTVKEPVTVKPTAEDLETWLEHQAWTVRDSYLEAIPDIKNPCKFPRKI